MNEMEIYFARENMLWNIGLYFFIGIGIFIVVTYTIFWLYDKYKEKHGRYLRKFKDL